MRYKAFISYANANTDIVENLRDHLGRNGVDAWVYSIDRTLAADTWEDIESFLAVSDMVIFVVSVHTPNAKGQLRELELALDKIEPVTGNAKIFPVVITGTDFSALPERLRFKNGLDMDARNVRTVALQIAKQAFPREIEEEIKTAWKHPVPGEWLEVSNLDPILEEYFDIGDNLYFRSISPMGLFECYSSKLGGLFWISPDNVKMSIDWDCNSQLEAQIPNIYSVNGMINIQQLGWRLHHEQKATTKTTD